METEGTLYVITLRAHRGAFIQREMLLVWGSLGNIIGEGGPEQQPDPCSSVATTCKSKNKDSFRRFYQVEK
jgi:hypothetical protein